jgi:spermidine dehydrogenase
MTPHARRLGLDRPISRRDFLNGVAIGVGATLAGRLLPAPVEALLAQDVPYPPSLTGLRGSHTGSFEILHALRDGAFWKTAGAAADTGEEYDLVVVGAGISGLTAAYRYRQARPEARVLVLDNHDDFGGHAKRNEFTVDGRTFVGYGGTQSIDSPRPYSEVARGLIDDLGIDVAGYGKVLDGALYKSLGLRPATFFDKETFGADALVVGDVRDEAFRAAAPFSEAVKRDLARLLTMKTDPMPGLSSAEKRGKLARMTYKDFVVSNLALDPGVLWPFQTRTHGLFGVGVDAVPAQDAYALGFPGFDGMGLDDTPGPGQNYDSMHSEEASSYYFHFPDGNATVARLLVRRLAPGVIPGTTAEDIVTSRADYGKLDVAGAPVRIRLSAPVLRVRHTGPQGGDQRVEVTYAQGSAPLKTVRARGVVLACWHSVIPAICPDLPAAQKAAMAYAIKVPLVYTNVFIRRWTAFQKLGVQRVSTPGMWHTGFNLDMPVSIGGYKHSANPADPIVLHLTKSACKPGLPTRAQHRAGRQELLSTPFAIIEQNIREQLGRALTGGGFDPARDILGITVNRWPHGYAYQYNSLEDDFWLNGGEQPCAVARKPFGRITIANSDAAAYAYTDAAIDHGHRAAEELLGT